MGIYKIFKWIYSFENETKVDLYESVSDLRFEVLLNKNERGLFFKLGHPHFKLLYNQDVNFVISHNSSEIKINHFLAKYDKDFGRRICEAYMFQSSNFNKEEEKHHSYYSKIEDDFLISFFKKNQSTFSINISGINFNISTCNLNHEIKHTFLCIECDSKINFEKFKHFSNTIITSIGFFSGNFYKSEEFYFQSKLKDFDLGVEFFYRSSVKKYVFPKPFTKFPNEWNWKFIEDDVLSKDLNNKWSSFIDEQVFELLVILLLDKPKIYFSIRIIFDFYNYPSISRVSLMFVVLETLCDELNKKTEFVNKELKKTNASKTLQKIKNKISHNEYLVFEDIINSIDEKLTNNTVHFEQTFKSLNINILEEDKVVLKQRNHFFHGRIIPNKFQVDSEEDLSILEKTHNDYSLRLYVLVSKIILKNIKFEGYLINYPKLFEINNNKNIKESYFLKI